MSKNLCCSWKYINFDEPKQSSQNSYISKWDYQFFSPSRVLFYPAFFINVLSPKLPHALVIELSRAVLLPFLAIHSMSVVIKGCHESRGGAWRSCCNFLEKRKVVKKKWKNVLVIPNYSLLSLFFFVLVWTDSKLVMEPCKWNTKRTDT